MDNSAHPPHPAVGGENPNYYDETSSVANGRPPAELAANAPASTHPPAQSHLAQSATHAPQNQQQYYPPPPPGPPPGHSGQAGHPNPLQSHPYSAAPPSYSTQEQPAVHFADEKPPVGAPHLAAHGGEIPPVMPPRPTSSSNQAPPQYFPGPPGEPGQTAVPPITEQTTAFDSTHPATKKSFGERFYQWGVKAGVPINKITNKLGSEAFWPTSMDKECDKAARILKSFCKDGFYTNDPSHPPPSPGHPTTPGPNTKGKALVKIPAQAIAQAKGLAIFTTFRTGLHISGAGGSGIIVARLPDGSWSPPSGFLVHTLGAGFMVGLDIYDCVCVLNTEEAVRAFTRPRLSLGGEVAVVAGPIGAGASLEGALGGGKPVWSYMKSRGFYAGVQADGTVVVQRPDANAAFYGEKLPVERILRGEVRPGEKDKDGNLTWPLGARQLIEVLKAAEGKKVDEQVMREVSAGPTPGDLAGTEGVGQKDLDAKNVRYG